MQYIITRYGDNTHWRTHLKDNLHFKIMCNRVLRSLTMKTNKDHSLLLIQCFPSSVFQGAGHQFVLDIWKRGGEKRLFFFLTEGEGGGED